MNANGAEYRECLLKAQPPYVPFVGLHTKDLIFYRDGNSDELERFSFLFSSFLFFFSLFVYLVEWSSKMILF